MDLVLSGTSDSYEVSHKFQLVVANDTVLLAISVQDLPNFKKFKVRARRLKCSRSKHTNNKIHVNFQSNMQHKTQSNCT